MCNAFLTTKGSTEQYLFRGTKQKRRLEEELLMVIGDQNFDISCSKIQMRLPWGNSGSKLIPINPHLL
jgi:hypothetical protein